MEEEKIDRILKLVDMLEVTDENRDDIAKVKKLIEQKKYAEMLEVLKKVTSKNETKIKEDNRTILFRNEEKEENKEEKEPIEEDDDVNSEEDEKAQMEKLLDNLEQEKVSSAYSTVTGFSSTTQGRPNLLSASIYGSGSNSSTL